VSCWVGSGNEASPFNGGCPNLETVLLEAGDLTIGPVDLPKLRDLRLQSGGLPVQAIQEVAKAKVPALETLHLWFGSEEYGATAVIADLEPIFAGANLPKLTHLGLMNAEFTNEICEELPNSAIAAQLEMLDLSMGTMTTEGAKALLEGKAAFPKLRFLNVDDNSIGAEGQALLEEFCTELKIGNQDDEEDRYVSVGE